MLRHADSTFKSFLSLCSILSAREIPTVGGATEFASTRVTYKNLAIEEKLVLEELIVEHDFVYSRGKVGFEVSEAEVT